MDLDPVDDAHYTPKYLQLEWAISGATLPLVGIEASTNENRCQESLKDYSSHCLADTRML